MDNEIPLYLSQSVNHNQRKFYQIVLQVLFSELSLYFFVKALNLSFYGKNGKKAECAKPLFKPLKFHLHWQRLLAILCHNNALLLALDTLGDTTHI